jgi:hypothetical protein
MNFDLERELRAALRKADPADGFAQRVAARIEREQPARSPWLARSLPRTAAALAASVLVTFIALYGWQARREQQGLEARRQLLEALRLTDEKLNLAYRGVHDASHPQPANDTGA